ncbi:single-stranded DNA-binding protein [Gordonia soli]|uniref:Single-stranded DNA-binding protein n=1 Tax=Gordonia soli NBRC 108243 TaxID=1223545 RepID=M0QNR2_9ACTN|nr:single-stranded DNA-binding protein [Gordonia soli]GAC69072.1 putative single-stranded DNA-binding protein [Gordonia soli NBRC 108243]
MYETFTTVIGTVVTEPRRRTTSTGEEVISFRVASTSRRLDRERQHWTDGPTLYLTVSCWRRLLTGVGAAIAKGRPIIAHGQIKTNEFQAADGSRRSDLEMTANSIGLDLSRCVVAYRGTPAQDKPADQAEKAVPESDSADTGTIVEEQRPPAAA